jgi:phosphatidylinositol-4,5-bisphosphate 3-kinase
LSDESRPQARIIFFDVTFFSPPVPIAQVIFKNGDDLRQDMLTLQVMRVMDTIWLQNGHDFKMNLYNVLPMGNNIGMIQVVPRSKTFGEIGVVDKQKINRWLKVSCMLRFCTFLVLLFR